MPEADPPQVEIPLWRKNPKALHKLTVDWTFVPICRDDILFVIGN